eukprot:GHVT01045250.1.p1 GENE.GHVT01045250.1~~GHVT01045250.1.p1  ORF type:complete len:193 (+),score=17.05 GHVT01045250.1:362-940(+)
MVDEVKLFGKWSYDDVNVSDLSLVDYIAVRDKACVFTPHTAGRYQKKRFRKALCPIVERLVNSMMMHGRNSGKKCMAMRIVEHAFEIISLTTDKNPIQVVVDAVKNGGPREDSTRIGSAGVVRRQAVDVSPIRRVNQAIYLICAGARYVPVGSCTFIPKSAFLLLPMTLLWPTLLRLLLLLLRLEGVNPKPT